MTANARTFSKADRVVDSREFTQILKRGFHAADQTLVVHVQKGKASPARAEVLRTRLGITIPKKTGNAVVRNRWKRRVREAFRQQRSRLPEGVDIVVRPRRGAACDSQAIYRSLPRLVQRASKKLR